MLALTLATITLVQAPQVMKPWVDQEGDPARPDSYVVSGLPELSPKAAWVSAQARAHEQRQERLAVVGQDYLDRHSPAWLPSFVGERVLRDWCNANSQRQGLQEVDRDLVVRTVRDGSNRMPPFAGSLSPAEINAVAAYLSQWRDRK